MDRILYSSSAAVGINDTNSTDLVGQRFQPGFFVKRQGSARTNSSEVSKVVALRDEAGAGAAIEAGTHMLDVRANRSRRDSQGCRDLGPVETLGQQLENFDFAWREWLAVRGRLTQLGAKGGDDLITHWLATKLESPPTQADRMSLNRWFSRRALVHATFRTG
jgi:hypothetical protein